MLPNPSDEQQDVINYFLQGYNIQTNCIAGSGKTTTLLHLAIKTSQFGGAKVLLLTYNKDLKDEIMEKSSSLKLNCDIYTYHAFASKIYKKNIWNDRLLAENVNIPPKTDSAYDVVFLDEGQDMNPYYKKLSTYTLKHGTMLVLVGDKRQCINEYNGSTSEYLVNYEKYFDTGRPWKQLSLRTSYRLTPKMASFVNKHILKEDLIIGGNNKTNYNPIYNYGTYDLKGLLKSMISKYKYKYEDIVILTPSTKSCSNPKSPLGRLISQKSSDLLFCVKESDSEHETSIGKILITSFNSMKGRERKCVIVTGFDESYFEFYNKNWVNPNELPNIIYVAATRATEMLILVQQSDKKPFRTIDSNELHHICDIHGVGKDETKTSTNSSSKLKASELAKHRHVDDIIKMMSYLKIEELSPHEYILNYQNIIQFGGYYEDMKKYYGILIPLYCEYLQRGTTYLYELGKQDTIKDLEDIVDRYNKLLYKERTLREWMEMVVLYTILQDRHHFYKEQIKHYEWVDEKFIKEATSLMLKTLPKEGEYEYDCSHNNVIGSIDYLTDDSIWEFKCTNTLTDEHIIQTAIYICLYYNKNGNLLPGNLYNVRTGQVLSVTVTNMEEFYNVATNKIM
jgi:hypothetical protein